MFVHFSLAVLCCGAAAVESVSVAHISARSRWMFTVFGSSCLLLVFMCSSPWPQTGPLSCLHTADKSQRRVSVSFLNKTREEGVCRNLRDSETICKNLSVEMFIHQSVYLRSTENYLLFMIFAVNTCHIPRPTLELQQY